MKRKIALVLIGLILIASLGFAIDTEFSLACLGSGFDKQQKTSVLENQIVPINEAFGLNADLTELETTAKSTETFGTWAPNIFATKISTSMPANGIKYEIIRDGETVNSQSTTIQQGDTIRLKPGVDIGNDWIAEGGSVDTPPITILEYTEYANLKQTLMSKFNQKYPYSNWYNIYRLETGNVEYFSTETTEFNETGNYYIADNGYPAYLVPAFNGKKAGVQIFTTLDPILEKAGCKKIGSMIECELDQTGILALTNSAESFVHIDKIIDGDKAIDAGWITEYGRDATSITYPRQYSEHPLNIQVVPPQSQAPKADFHCEWEKRSMCDASASFDPDGIIEAYEWNTNDVYYSCVPSGNTCTPTKVHDASAHTYNVCYGSRTIAYDCRQSITITLTVTDNDGFTAEKTKTFNLVNSTEEARDTFTLTANHQNGMAQITAECDGVVTLDIENAVTEKPEIEKVEIPCGKTTPIGPFTTKGAYRVIGSNNGETREPIFTVD